MNNPIIDSHFHWLQADINYPWMVTDRLRELENHSLAELEGEFTARGIVGGVVVQAVGDVRETIALLAGAAVTPSIVGVVGWLDLTSARFHDDLEIIRESPGGNKLVGLRHQAEDESDPSWLLRGDVRRGLKLLSESGLSFDLLIRQRELPAARELAIALPGLTLVVDHLAKPVIEADLMAQWRDDLSSIAQLPNTWCKLSGLVTEVVPWGEWDRSDLEPFIRSALEVFGPSRCMFGSDWPVCLLSASYSDVSELLQGALSSLSNNERADVLSGSALRAYRLDIADEFSDGNRIYEEPE